MKTAGGEVGLCPCALQRGQAWFISTTQSDDLCVPLWCRGSGQPSLLLCWMVTLSPAQQAPLNGIPARIVICSLPSLPVSGRLRHITASVKFVVLPRVRLRQPDRNSLKRDANSEDAGETGPAGLWRRWTHRLRRMRSLGRIIF